MTNDKINIPEEKSKDLIRISQASAIVAFICIQYLSNKLVVFVESHTDCQRSHQDHRSSYQFRSIMMVVRKEVITLVHMNKFVQLFHGYTDKINRVLYSHRCCVGISIAPRIYALFPHEWHLVKKYLCLKNES